MARDLSNRLKAAAGAVALVREKLAALGPLRVEGGALYAGDTLINGDEALVDAVYDATLFGSTVFLGGTRIATRAVAAGTDQRATGTSAAPEVIEQVYGRGEVYTGTTETLGNAYAIVYEPLVDAEGRRVGMIAGYRELLG